MIPSLSDILFKACIISYDLLQVVLAFISGILFSFFRVFLRFFADDSFFYTIQVSAAYQIMLREE